MSMKLDEHMPKGVLRIQESVLSSAEILAASTMNYWLEKISPEDIAKLWSELQGCVRGAKPRITSEAWANGTISKADFRVVVTVPITGDGFVLTFTARDTST